MANTLSHYRGFNFLLGRREVGAGRAENVAPSSLAVTHPQPSDNLRWKWVSSTSLLCYGQIAKHTKEQILPWVDNIASRMVYYFSCGPCVRPAPPLHRKAAWVGRAPGWTHRSRSHAWHPWCLGNRAHSGSAPCSPGSSALVGR